MSYDDLVPMMQSIDLKDDDGTEHNPEGLFNGTLYFNPTDVEELFERVKDKVKVVMPLTVMDYGMREFRIVDPNGYELSFGQDTQGTVS